MATVVGRRVEVGGWVGALGGLLGRGGDRRLIERPPAQRLLGSARPQRRRPHVGQADANVLARGVRGALDGRAHADSRPILAAAVELLIADAEAVERRQCHPRQDLVGGERRRHVAAKQLARGDRPLARGALRGDMAVRDQQHGPEVRRRLAVGERAADRAAVSHLLVGDRRGGAGDEAELAALLKVRVAGHRPDPKRAVVALDAAQAGHPAQVDQQRRRREAQLHQRDERVPAGEQLRTGTPDASAATASARLSGAVYSKPAGIMLDLPCPIAPARSPPRPAVA